MRDFVKTWWYASRPHTLGASLAPMVIVAAALLSEGDGGWMWGRYLLCLVVAVTAQIASNMANDYFDYRNGKDTEARLGFERLLAKGKVTPRQMLVGLAVVVLVCALCGIALIGLKGWGAVAIGVVTLLGVFAYSAGPYPLSHHGWGDLAVVFFFGLVPVLGSYWVAQGMPPLYLLLLGLGIGVWEANILVANNYRDYAEDKQSGKQTLIVRLGEWSGPVLYRLNTVLSLSLLSFGLLMRVGSTLWVWVVLAVVAFLFALGSTSVGRLKGRSLNRLLAYTSRVAVLTALLLSLPLIL